MVFQSNKYIFILIFLVFFLSLPAAVWGDDKTTIQVNFKINEENYRDFFGTNTPFIENQLKTKIVELLNNNLMFLRFVESPAQEAPDANRLSILLDKREKGGVLSQLNEVGFWMHLSGPAIVHAEKELYTKFRPAEDYNRPLGSIEGFLEEIAFVLDTFIKNNRDTMMDKLFSNIVIAKEAFLLPERLRWILPLVKDNISAETESVFRIDTEIDDMGMVINRNFDTVLKGKTTRRSTTIPEKYRNGMVVTEITNPDNQPLDIIDNQTFLAIKVYLIKYIPEGLRMLAASPDDFNALMVEDGE